MSRSYKKPFHAITCRGSRAGAMKEWKQQCNRKIRRNHLHEKIGESPSEYRKLICNWDSPSEGKTYNPEWKKAYRK